MNNPQVNLPLKLAENYSLESFYAGANEELLKVIHEFARTGVENVLYIWGSEGAGKSHLLQGMVQKAVSEQQLAAYIPIDSPHITRELIGQLQPSALLCLDDVDRVGDDQAWQEALLDLFERCRSAGGRLVLTASSNPATNAFTLKDLGTRFSSGLMYRIHTLDDYHRGEAIKWRAKNRGLVLSDQTTQYLLRRISRAPADLFRTMDTIDQASLEHNRAVTIPFLKELGIK